MKKQAKNTSVFTLEHEFLATSPEKTDFWWIKRMYRDSQSPYDKNKASSTTISPRINRLRVKLEDPHLITHTELSDICQRSFSSTQSLGYCMTLQCLKVPAWDALYRVVYVDK